MIKYLMSFILIILLAPLALADYHYASHTGTNTPPYTSWATAADSIQKAVDAATAGDTIYVGAGLWEETQIQLHDTLSLIGMGIDSSIIRNGDTTTYLRPGSHTLIQGFTFDGIGQDYYCNGIYPHYRSHNVTIFGNNFTNLRFTIWGVFTGNIYNNIFDGNYQVIDGTVVPCSLNIESNTVINSENGSVIAASDGQWFIKKNIFARNPYSGSRMILLGMHRPGIDTAYFANNLLYRNYEYEHPSNNELIVSSSCCYFQNNTFVGFDDAERYIVINTVSLDWFINSVEIKNAIVTGFENAFRIEGDSITTYISYCNFWNNANIIDSTAYGHYDTIIGNIYTDPMFTDTTGFQLQAFSPCIDAGDPNILDVDGTRSDIGCYGGPLGQSYVYQDLAPAIPESLRADIGDDSLLIRWHYNTEADFNRYYFYKDTILGFTPSISTLIAQPETSVYIDRDFDRQHNYYYRITGMDFQGNMSNYSAELGVRFVNIDNWGNPTLPRVTEIKSTYPNPFNSMITIGYYLADIGYQPAEVKLYIYDIGGRLVRKLVDCRQYPGKYTVTWDGKTNGGEQLSSGVYFSRLSVSGCELQKPRKITLMK